MPLPPHLLRRARCCAVSSSCAPPTNWPRRFECRARLVGLQRDPQSDEPTPASGCSCPGVDCRTGGGDFDRRKIAELMNAAQHLFLHNGMGPTTIDKEPWPPGNRRDGKRRLAAWAAAGVAGYLESIRLRDIPFLPLPSG